MKKQDKKASNISWKVPCVGCGKPLRSEHDGYYCISCQNRQRLIQETEDKPLRDIIQLDYDPFSFIHEGDDTVWLTFQKDFRRTEYVRLQFPPSASTTELLNAIENIVNCIINKIDKDNPEKLNFDIPVKANKLNINPGSSPGVTR